MAKKMYAFAWQFLLITMILRVYLLKKFEDLSNGRQLFLVQRYKRGLNVVGSIDSINSIIANKAQNTFRFSKAILT